MTRADTNNKHADNRFLVFESYTFMWAAAGTGGRRKRERSKEAVQHRASNLEYNAQRFASASPDR